MTVKQHTNVSAEGNAAQWLALSSELPLSSVQAAICKRFAHYVTLPASRAIFNETGSMVVNPSQRRLAKDIGDVSQQAVSKAIQGLVHFGLVRVNVVGSVLRTSSEYELIGREPRDNRDRQPTDNLLKLGKGTDNQAKLSVATPANKGQNAFSDRQPSLSKLSKKVITYSSSSEASYSTTTVPVDLEALWPRKNQDAAALDLAWRKVVASGLDPAFVLKQADRWCLWWSAGTPANKVPHLGQWLSAGGFRKEPPFDHSYPEWYARMLKQAKDQPAESDEDELPDPDLDQFREMVGDVEPGSSTPPLTWEMVVANNLDFEDEETLRLIKERLGPRMFSKKK